MTREKQIADFVVENQTVDQTIGHWLPENYAVKLTALEIGGLIAVLEIAKSEGAGAAMICKPGPKGEPIPISLIDRLIEKVMRSAAEADK